MATVTLTDLFSNLNGWQGDLLWAGTGTTITKTTASVFSYVFGAGHQFAGYTVTIRGTGFAYSGTTPTGGDMAKLVITDGLGQTVLTVAGITANTLASDISLFAAYSFGWSDPNGGSSGPQVKNAWSQLLTGNDVFNGTAGDDIRGMVGVNAGDDVFNMGTGDDVVEGGLGDDTINGDGGYDTLSYEQTHWNEGIPMVRGITVNMVNGVGTVLDPFGYTDQFTGIEKIIGSAFNDQIFGGVGNNDFRGLRGNDTMSGGGSDDWVVYHDDAGLGGKNGIIVNLSVVAAGGTITGTIMDGFGNIDTTIDIESVRGTRYNDKFVGSSAQNKFAGGEGKDSYDGRGGATDTIWFFMSNGNSDPHGINVDLSLASGQIKDDGYGNVENVTSIEWVVGTMSNDRIKGSSGANLLEGLGGIDTLTGGGGHDQFAFFHDFAFNNNDVITDFTAGAGAERDVLYIGMSAMSLSTTLTLVNGTAATAAVGTFIFNTANDTLFWDVDGTGSNAMFAVCTLNGVNALSAANFDLV